MCLRQDFDTAIIIYLYTHYMITIHTHTHTHSLSLSLTHNHSLTHSLTHTLTHTNHPPPPTHPHIPAAGTSDRKQEPPTPTHPFLRVTMPVIKSVSVTSMLVSVCFLLVSVSVTMFVPARQPLRRVHY